MRKTTNSINLNLHKIHPLNAKQSRVLDSRNNQILTGSAGTGKTYLASYIGFKEVLRGHYDRVLYVRSAVPTRDIGFLPGTEREKMEVYTKPYVDICSELFQSNQAYALLEKQGQISFEATSFVRGRTFRSSFIIVDECQNMTFHELDSLITRLDEDCRIIFCGDTNQADLSKNGFGLFYSIISRMKEFDNVRFEIEDVVRSGLVKEYLKRKESHFKG